MAPETEDKNARFSYRVHLPQSLGQTPQDMELAWMMSDTPGSQKGNLKDEKEVQERERGSQSS